MSKATDLTRSGRFPMPKLENHSGLSPSVPPESNPDGPNLLSVSFLVWGAWAVGLALVWWLLGPLSLAATVVFGLVLTLSLNHWAASKQSTEVPRVAAAIAGDAKETTDSLELQLQQAQKLEAVGRLAGGVAHDFNNLLTVIQGYGALLLDVLRDRADAADMVRDIMKAGDKATALTRQLLFFSRKQVPLPRRIDVNTLVANLEKMLRRLIGEDVNLTVKLAPGSLPVKIDPGQLEQVIMNLVVNARDAMPTGGNLTISTELAPSGQNFAILSVADTGTGMDEEVKAHLFEPFFTTKQPGKGTGLGLATVHGIVQHYGGFIQVRSSPGAGAEFRIRLPLTHEEASLEETPFPTTPPRRGTETILLVEDEKEVRDMARIVLENHGYQVVEARHGQEALELCKRRHGNFHLLVTDVVMPVMGGVELMENLASRYPAIKILFMSGYNESAVVRHGLQEELLACLHKPFTPDELAETVRELLDTPATMVTEPRT